MRAGQENNGFRRTGSTTGANSASGYGYQGNNANYSVGTTGSGDYKNTKKSTSYGSSQPKKKSEFKISLRGDGHKDKPHKEKTHKDKPYKEKKHNKNDDELAESLGKASKKFNNWLDGVSSEFNAALAKETKKSNSNKSHGHSSTSNHGNNSHGHSSTSNHGNNSHGNSSTNNHTSHPPPSHSSGGGAKFCSQCGGGLAGAARFCTSCGAAVIC